MNLSIICCLSKKNNGIGFQNKLPWKIKDDMKLFMELTQNKIVIMGRKTFQSIGKPLKNRFNIVLSKDKKDNLHNVKFVSSIQEAVNLAKIISQDSKYENEIMIIGGESIYKQTIDIVETLYLSFVDTDIKADTHFPKIDANEWISIHQKYYPKNNRNEYSFNFKILKRK